MTTTSSPPQLLEPGQRLPAAVLQASDGPAVDLHHLRHDSIVAVVAHPGCSACAEALADLDRAAADLRAWNALPAAVVRDADEARALAATLSAPVLVDRDGRVGDALGLGADGGAVVVADRYGTVHRIDPLGDDHRRPSAAELETEVRYIAIQCPECSVPSWSW